MVAIVDTDARLRAHTFLGHPRGLVWLCLTEVWERFSYYGMQVLLVLYLTHQLLLSGHVEHILGFGPFRAAIESVYGPLSPQALASAIFGIYAGLVWFTPILGGLLADRVIGRTRAVVVGALLMVIGHFAMAFDASFLIAMTCLLIGVGCFKGNLAGQVSALYRPDDPRVADAFQIYVFGIQIAVVVSPLVCGTLGETLGWHIGFGAAGVGMTIGLATYLAGRRWLEPDAPRRRTDHARPPLGRDDWRRIAMLAPFIPLLALATVGNNQVGDAYLIWAETTLERNVLGFTIPATWLFGFESIFTGVAIIGSVAFWRWWSDRRGAGDEVTRIVFGATLLTLAPIFLALASRQAALSGHKASIMWVPAMAAFNELGWANAFIPGLALFSRCSPPAINATMIGAFYLNVFLSNMLVGYLGGWLERVSGATFWMTHVAIMGVATLAIIALAGPARRVFGATAGSQAIPERVAVG